MNVGSLFKQGADKSGGYIGQAPCFSRIKGSQATHAVWKIGDFRGDDQNAGVTGGGTHDAVPFQKFDAIDPGS